MELGESKEDYLETIYLLGNQGKKPVKGIEVAGELGLSKASVCLAAKKLAELGYLEYDKEHELILTERGLALAEKVYERHKFWTSVLIEIGVSEETAGNDACRMEHVLTDESYDKIKMFFNDAKRAL